MKIIVTGLERSGTRWMTALLALHPDVSESVHTSIPQEYMPDTHFPDLSNCDSVVWMIRYEPFRLLSMNNVDFNVNRPERFLPPQLYSEATSLLSNKVVFASYESLLSPFGLPYFLSILKQLHLDPALFPTEMFTPKDGNEKYLIQTLTA